MSSQFFYQILILDFKSCSICMVVFFVFFSASTIARAALFHIKNSLVADVSQTSSVCNLIFSHHRFLDKRRYDMRTFWIKLSPGSLPIHRSNNIRGK
jgi:hypothetical protein